MIEPGLFRQRDRKPLRGRRWIIQWSQLCAVARCCSKKVLAVGCNILGSGTKIRRRVVGLCYLCGGGLGADTEYCTRTIVSDGFCIRWWHWVVSLSSVVDPGSHGHASFCIFGKPDPHESEKWRDPTESESSCYGSGSVCFWASYLQVR